MLHITIEGTTASLVFMNNGSFIRKNLPYVEAVTLTKGISPVKVIREKSERFGTRIIKCYDVLHTQGKEYLVEDITDYVREKGVNV